MYCPNCGNQTSTEQNFCRSCGLGLEKIAQSLAEQLPTQIDANQQKQKERIEKQGVIALSIFAAGIIGLLLYLVVYKVIFVQGRTLEGLGILAFLALISSGLVSVYLFAKANEVGQKNKTREISGSDEPLPSTRTAKLLREGYFEPVPTVTERTTDLLTVEKNNRRSES
jgi:zinc-ribbon domain